MRVRLNLSSNMLTEALLTKKNIPCLCKIGKNFEISFGTPLPATSGEVVDWDRRAIDDRVPAGVGTDYTHFAPGMVSFIPLPSGDYRVSDLSMFNRSVGWRTVLADGIYAPERKFWDEED